MLEVQEYIDAIENGNPNQIRFETDIIQQDSNRQVKDYKFAEEVIIRQTIVPLLAAQPPGIVTVGFPLKYRLEFISPETKNGHVLREDRYDD